MSEWRECEKFLSIITINRNNATGLKKTVGNGIEADLQQEEKHFWDEEESLEEKP